MAQQRALVGNREITEDTLFDGALTCLQFRDGYRFSVDAVLAAHFREVPEHSKILDIGSGCGIIGLIMMYRWSDRISLLCGLELQPQLKVLAEKNFSLNGFSDKCRVKKGSITDALQLFKPESFTHVVCNPPFYRVSTGRQSGHDESRLARHQISADINDYAKGSAALVKNGGTVVFIYPAEQSIELFHALVSNNLAIKRLQFVYSYPEPEQDAKLVLAECRKNGGPGTRIMNPFYIYSCKNGDYTSEMQALYSSHSIAR